MPVPRRQVYASEHAKRHMLEKHGVEYEEAEEALLSVQTVERVRTTTPSERRYLARGRTVDGRRLNVVFAREPEGRARIITAYEPRTRRQRRRHGRR